MDYLDTAAQASGLVPSVSVKAVLVGQGCGGDRSLVPAVALRVADLDEQPTLAGDEVIDLDRDSPAAQFGDELRGVLDRLGRT